MAGNFLQGDPAAMQNFAQRTLTNSETLQAIRTNRSGLVQNDLAPAFTGHGGAAAQAVNAEVMDPLGRKNERRQLENSGNIGNAATAYDVLQSDNAREMNRVTGAVAGPIVDLLNQPSAKA